jgi:hypothetical protein
MRGDGVGWEEVLSPNRCVPPQGAPRRSRYLAAALILATGLVGLTTPAPARAALGGPSSSVEADRAHLAARLSSRTAATYAVHTLTLSNNMVREYTAANGTVFAVSWRGVARPDLRQLLGGYFDTFQADNALHGGRRARRPMAVNRSDFVVRTGGHSGAFWGVAILPRAAPAGFSASDLQ